jgi:hypothetical protein
MITGPTAIVNNQNEYVNGMNICVPDYKKKKPLVYRKRTCDTNLTNGTPEEQFQRQKIIQNTVRVASSLYTMNLGSLSAYQSAAEREDKVCWNQMSDRAEPHIQKNVTSSGSTYGGSSTKRSIVRLRPGAMSPGGKGVDIKHNSYARRLNRLKGQSNLKQGTIPPDYGAPIPFNPAFPVYGGKTVKTNIVAGCVCPSPNPNLIYENSIQNNIYKIVYVYSPGQKVYVIQCDLYEPYVYVGTVVSQVSGNEYSVLLENGSVQTFSSLLLLPYVDLNSDAGSAYLAQGGVFSDVYNYIKCNKNKCPISSTIGIAIQKDINDILNY